MRILILAVLIALEFGALMLSIDAAVTVSLVGAILVPLLVSWESNARFKNRWVVAGAMAALVAAAIAAGNLYIFEQALYEVALPRQRLNLSPTIALLDFAYWTIGTGMFAVFWIARGMLALRRK